MNHNARFSRVFTVEELRRIYKATGLLNCGPPPQSSPSPPYLPVRLRSMGFLFWIAHHAAQ